MITSVWVLFIMRTESVNSCIQHQNTHFKANNVFFFRKSYILWDNVEKYCTACHRWQYGACTLHVEYLRLKSHTQNMYYLMILQGVNGYANAPQYSVLRTLPVVLKNLYTHFVNFLYVNILPLPPFSNLYLWNSFVLTYWGRNMLCRKLFCNVFLSFKILVHEAVVS